MEKLIELLNECNEWWHWRDENFDANKLLVISKKYWFIKRLVENDKIDIKAVCNKEIESWYDIESTTAEESLTDEEWNRFYTDLCLMLLSISDTPIDDLISYLK